MPSLTTKPRILIVDDDEQVRKLLKAYLQEENDCRDVASAHSLGLRVIAEGIETESQHDFLRLLRCDEGQGFLLGRPAAAEAIDWSSLNPKRKPNLVVNSRTEKTFPRAINQ